MAGQGQQRTLLELLLEQEDHTYEEMVRRFERQAAELDVDATITTRHLRRLASGQQATTNPSTRRVMQAMFGTPIDQLLAPPPAGHLVVQDGLPVAAGSGLQMMNREILAMAAKRAHNFSTFAAQSNLTGEAMTQLQEEVAWIATSYQQQPLADILQPMAEIQDTLFTLLEGRQQPAYTRQLLLLAGVISGLLAKSSHDMGDPHSAIKQSRTAFLCADNADHNGLRSWIRGLQSLISYWAGRQRDSIRYAQQGAAYGATNTTAVWLPVSEARAWAALGNAEQARLAVQRAELSWDGLQEDDLDELGGICTFSRARQLYYAADALAWLPSEADSAESYSTEAVEAYSDETAPEWAFGDAAGSACDLAIARIAQGEIEGAVEAVEPVLTLPGEQRINGIVASVKNVHRALTRAQESSTAAELQERIEMFSRTPLLSR